MAYEAEVLRRATRQLEERRGEREAAVERRKQEIYRHIPRVAEIDRQLRRTITGILSSTLRNGEEPVQTLAQVRKENLSLQAERAELLVAHGYPADVLDEHPLCAKCGDRGWNGAQLCSCLNALCKQEQIKTLSSLLNLGEQSFEQFCHDYYTTDPWQGEPLSPRQNMDFIFDLCKNYAQNFKTCAVKNLLLNGSPGLGKTFLSACIARVVSEQGYSVVYDTAVNLFARFDEQKFSRSQEDTQSAKTDTRRYLTCDLLIIDDLGSEMITSLVQSSLYTVVNTRLIEGRRTVISTNLHTGELRGRYGAQTASRLQGEYYTLRFYGDDIRLRRKRAAL